MENLKDGGALRLHPIDIYKAIDAEFGEEEWLSWESATLIRTVLPEAPAESESEALDKIMAVQAAAANSTLVLSDSMAFEKTVNAFCNNGCIPDCLQPPEIEEVFYAVKQLIGILQEVHGMQESEIHFTCEIPGYVAAVAAYHNWVVLPKPLWFAQEMLFSLTHLEPGTEKCKDNEAFIHAGEVAIEQLELGPFDDMDALLGDSFSSMFIGRIVGAYLYDPTKAYNP